MNMAQVDCPRGGEWNHLSHGVTALYAAQILVARQNGERDKTRSTTIVVDVVGLG